MHIVIYVQQARSYYMNQSDILGGSLRTRPNTYSQSTNIGPIYRTRCRKQRSAEQSGQPDSPNRAKGALRGGWRSRGGFPRREHKYTSTHDCVLKHAYVRAQSYVCIHYLGADHMVLVLCEY